MGDIFHIFSVHNYALSMQLLLLTVRLKISYFYFLFFSLPLQILKFISYTNGEFVPIKISFTKNNEYTCISTTWNFFKKTLIFKSFLLDIFGIYGTISSENNLERMFDTYEN